MADGAPGAGRRRALRAFRHRDYRLFWAGQGTSVLGTWMQTTAQSWLLYRLVPQPLWLGLLALARFGQALVLAPGAGLLVDRLPCRWLMLRTQAASLVLAALLAGLTLAGRVRPWQILVLALVQGGLDCLDATARYLLQMDVVGEADLQSALALNSVAFHSARMLGPWLAGVAIARWGEGPCFVLNAASYLAVLAALGRMGGPARGRTPPAPAGALGAGLRHAWGTPAIRRVLLGVALTSLAGLSVNAMAPALAREVLGAGPDGFGWLLAGGGVGAVLGALVAAAAAPRRRVDRFQALVLAALGLAILALARARHLAPAVLGMAALWCLGSIQLATSNAFLQATTPAALRGRVMALYVWVFQGLSPVGSLAVGWLASRRGLPAGLAWAGSGCLAGGLALVAVTGFRGGGAGRTRTGDAGRPTVP